MFQITAHCAVTKYALERSGALQRKRLDLSSHNGVDGKT
jgi:hypothetical protein